jgi:endogenous inhibitor of DNA gyrase (YacG/DUF329 family)
VRIFPVESNNGTRIKGMKNSKIKCPVCRKETQWDDNPFKPFCSERCKLIDLGKWASEDYRIPGEKKDIPDAEEDEKKDGER